VVANGGVIAGIYDLAPTADGAVRVEVGDRIGPAAITSLRQWRTFAWAGHTFVQTDGPTVFPRTRLPSSSASALSRQLGLSGEPG
jgi:hypothetical protein